MKLQGKVAIVTGAAQGIGRQYALRFAREGAAVMVVDLREQQAQQVAREIVAAGGQAKAVKADVTCQFPASVSPVTLPPTPSLTFCCRRVRSFPLSHI